MLVDTAPVFSIHDVKQAPEDLLVITDVHQKHSSDVVHTLHVAYLAVVVSVGHQNIVKHLLPFLRLPVEVLALTLEVLQATRIVCESTTDVFLDSHLILGVAHAAIAQLLIQTGVMGGLLAIAPTKHGPDVPSHVRRYAVEKRLPHPLPTNNLQRIKLIVSLVDLNKTAPLTFA